MNDTLFVPNTPLPPHWPTYNLFLSNAVMTTIDRLGLLGIRSYGTDEETFIKFYKPLTIILGRNGSGKSSIIEAVKMATTGDLPPNVERGAAFIHDPRIHNETETKAKIRLMFTNVRGDQYIVSRHFQLAIRKGLRGVGYKTEFKRLDQTVKRMEGGSVSSFRCTDLNALLPDIMRVTKPVLNNVIFVHQEDSLWPLADPKKLKEKFDDIFAATRYTKALDTIRKFRRDQAAELRVVNTELMHYEDKVKILEKIRADVDEIRVKHDELKQGIDTLDNEMAQLKIEKEAAEEIANEYVESTAKLERLKTESAIIERDKADKYSEMQLHLPDMDEDALATEMAELETLLERASGERSKRAKLIDELIRDIDSKRAEYHKRQNRKGMLDQQAKTNAERVCRVDDMKREFMTSDTFADDKTNARGLGNLLAGSDSISSWTKALAFLQNDAESNVEAVTRQSQKNADDASSHLNELKARLREARGDIERKTQETSEKRTKIAKIRNELRDTGDSEATIKEAESKFKTVEQMWREKYTGTRARELEEQITRGRKEVSSVREDLIVLRGLKEQIVENQSEQNRFELYREDEIKRKKRVESTIEDFTELTVSAISELEESGEDDEVSEMKELLNFDSELTEANAHNKNSKFQSVTAMIMARKDALLQRAERQHSEATAQVQSIAQRRAELNAQVSTTKRELETVLHSIRQRTKPMSERLSAPVIVEQITSLFNDVQISAEPGYARASQDEVNTVRKTAEDIEKEIVRASQKVTVVECGRVFAQSDLDAFEEDPKHKCPACGLSSSKREGDMRRKLEQRVEHFKNPESLRKAQNDLHNLELLSTRVKEIHSISLEASALFESFEADAEKSKNIEAVLRKSRQTQMGASDVLESLKERFGSGSATHQLESKRIELNQIFFDWDRALKQLQAVQSNLSATMPESRALADVDEETRKLEDRVQKLQENIDKDSRALEREREDIRRAESRFHQAKQRCLELQTMAEKHERLKAEKDELTTSVRTVESEIEELRSKTKSLQSNVEYAEEEFVAVRAESGATLRIANDLLSKRRMAFHSWKDLIREVEAYESSGKEKELRNLLKSLNGIRLEIDSETKDLRAHEREQQTASDSQKEMESRIRNLSDNQKYRIQERKLQVSARSARHVQDEISALEQRAEGDPRQRVVDLTNKLNAKNAMRAATQGRRQAFTESYKEKKKELNDAEKQGSRHKFDESRIRKQTMELASSDLEKYHRALDQALMAFHTLKMNSINRTIKELWQQTYRGTDIDDIEIISDHSDSRAAPGGLKRTFDYRVQMRQGQATLDMRGRCSAGQKVLACLVIRLALAESFCTDCGILALDEPTTNLDRENIESLAAALKTIIETRRKQRNFQLILITHDQEFIDMIGAREFCNEYFMVFKDVQGVSRARVQNLQEM